ncbi:30S ribosomal protein S6 [bacterium]|nr:30S ribosomal protein S6 [bacterium]
MKRYYECTFIVNPGLDDGQIENTVKMAEDTIVKNGGELVNTEHIGRRRLAYPISKKHNGYYITVEFQAEGRIIEKVERFLTLDENVMRFLTLTLDARELKAKQDRLAFAMQDRGKDGKSEDRKPDDKKADEKKADEKKADEKKADDAKADEKPADAKEEKKEEEKADEKAEKETEEESKDA